MQTEQMVKMMNRKPRTRRSKSENTAGYQPDTKMRLVERVCHFLNWGAEHHPGQLYTWTIITREVLGMGQTPKINSHEVEMVFKTSSRLKPLLQRLYQRDLISARDLGIRASIDADDIVQNAIYKPVGRVRSAIKSLQATRDLVNPSDISNTPEMRPHKEFFIKGVIPTLKVLNGLEEKLRALTPVPPEEKAR